MWKTEKASILVSWNDRIPQLYIEVTGVRFLKAPKLFGHISCAIILSEILNSCRVCSCLSNLKHLRVGSFIPWGKKGQNLDICGSYVYYFKGKHLHVDFGYVLSWTYVQHFHMQSFNLRDQSRNKLINFLTWNSKDSRWKSWNSTRISILEFFKDWESAGCPVMWWTNCIGLI